MSFDGRVHTDPGVEFLAGIDRLSAKAIATQRRRVNDDAGSDFATRSDKVGVAEFAMCRFAQLCTYFHNPHKQGRAETGVFSSRSPLTPIAGNANPTNSSTADGDHADKNKNALRIASQFTNDADWVTCQKSS